MTTLVRVALTVHNPWAWAIMHAGKDVENRRWYTPHRGTLWVHAGKRFDPDSGLRVDPADVVSGALLGSVEVVDCVRDHRSRWAEHDQWHWVLADPRPLAEPIPMRGQQKLWTLPETVAVRLTQ